jgi:hypothetical protein
MVIQETESPPDPSPSEDFNRLAGAENPATLSRPEHSGTRAHSSAG